MKTYFELRESLQINERAHYAFDTQKAAKAFGSKVNGMPMNIVKVGSGKYYVVELRPGTKQADQEKAAKIAVSIGLSESYINEAKIKVTAFAGDEGGGESYKKYGLRLKKVGASYGYDDVELSGPTLAVIKFAQRNLGVEGKSIRDIQKELDNM